MECGGIIRVLDIELFLRSYFIYQGDHITDSLGIRSYIILKLTLKVNTNQLYDMMSYEYVMI